VEEKEGEAVSGGGDGETGYDFFLKLAVSGVASPSFDHTQCSTATQCCWFHMRPLHDDYQSQLGLPCC
jgi:hypothetical protein